MSKESLPIKIDPFRFADNAIQLQGELQISELPRLRPSLHSDQGEINVQLSFGKDEEGIRYIQGHYETQLTLQCQRCMEPIVYEIMNDFVSGIVGSEEEAEQLPGRYDPVMAKNGTLNLPEMIEDELIVSLPIVPMHNPNDCQVKMPLAADSGSLSESEKENPFKVIELLRKKRDTK